MDTTVGSEHLEGVKFNFLHFKLVLKPSLSFRALKKSLVHQYPVDMGGILLYWLIFEKERYLRRKFSALLRKLHHSYFSVKSWGWFFSFLIKTSPSPFINYYIWNLPFLVKYQCIWEFNVWLERWLIKTAESRKSTLQPSSWKKFSYF